jgi:hypothetical protein
MRIFYELSQLSPNGLNGTRYSRPPNDCGVFRELPHTFIAQLRVRLYVRPDGGKRFMLQRIDEVVIRAAFNS